MNLNIRLSRPGLPRISPGDPAAISSLTVARQRGILTRFPVLTTAMRAREPKVVVKELKQSMENLIVGTADVK
jgi:hypothetical protein